jgi:Tfp pilus assembly protein PilF
LAYHDQGDDARGKQDLDRSAQMKADNWQTLVVRAVLKDFLGRQAEAIEDCRAALAADPEHRTKLGFDGKLGGRSYSCTADGVVH